MDQASQIVTSTFPVPVVHTGTKAARDCVRVLHIVNGEYYAGAERVQDLLALHLPEFECESGFVCVKADQFPTKRMCQRVPLSSVTFNHPLQRQAVNKIGDVFSKGKYDLLHSHTPRSAWAALAASDMVGCPIVHTMHDVSLRQHSSPARWLFNKYTIARLQKADVVTTVSPESHRLADQFGLGRKRRMILNGVPSARTDFRRKPPGEYWTIGTVGLIRPCKGIEVLIRALAELRSRHCNVRAVAVGTFYQDDYEREVMSLVDELDVNDLIDFVGFSSDVPGHLENFDLFAMPSVGPEGLPMVLIEAMAHGLPAIGSDVPGVGDIVRSGEDGLLFPPGDHRALADGIARFVDGELDWHSISQSVQTRHASEFSAQRMAGEFAEVYWSVLGKDPA